MLQTSPYDLDDILQAEVRADGRARAQVYRAPWVAVVLGRGSKPELELDLDAVSREGVSVLRRAGGGCAVLLDPGNLVVSLALRLPGLGRSKEAFQAISTWLIEGLAALGVPDLQQRGISDLCLGERKVGGSCIHRSKDFLYYSTTLLLRPDLQRVERLLRHPPREPDYRAGRRHREFMGRLPLDADAEQIARQLATLLDGQQLLGQTVEVGAERS